MKVGLADVAARAGVSVATVSRVLNDRPGVNEATRRAVLTAVDVLGYDRPSRLRARGAGLVGVVVAELDNPFFPAFARALETPLVHGGYTPVLCTQSLGGIHEDDYVQALLGHGVAGIVFVSGIHAVAGTDVGRYLRLTEQGLPLVLVNGHLPGVPAAFVSNDDVRSVDLAVSHLVHMGHRRIGLALGQRRYVPVLRRIEGYNAAMRRYVDPDLSDADLEPWVACTWFTVDGGATAARQLLELEPTAIVCGSDVMALGVVRAARQAGLRVPGDLSVVGSDDGLLMEFVDPPLTTVRQPAAAMGAAAVRTLLEQIAGAAAPAAEMVFEPELVVRGSTAPAPA
jgi:LacI family transcriptional regulator, repressor for deo operon, udp, cdd, tsx, nupC, and nupG